MSSPVLTPIDGQAPGPQKPTQKPSAWKKVLITAAAIICLVASVCILLWSRIWPFTEKAVAEDLAEASDSEVTIRSSHETYFPVPGCVLEGIEFHHGPDKWKLITIDRLRIEGSYLGVLLQRVPHIKAEGGHVFVPPFGSNVTFKSQHSKLVVEELIANGAVVEFASDDPQKQPLRFEVSEARLHEVQWGSPIGFQLKLHNPQPPGEISTSGKFGAWTSGRPGDTPLSGEYTFEHADLGVYGGIAGTLSSKGKYDGNLKHVNVDGTTDVPNFEVKSGGHRVDLTTRFNAYVDAIHGDTFLKRVEAQFGRTKIVAEGSVAGAKGRKGKVAVLHLASRQGRIEDILGLFTSERRAPMSGAVVLTANTEIPSGDDPFLEKVRLQGNFGIDDGSFSKLETQESVNELSAGARGEKVDDAETVLTDLKGRVVLEHGVANFADLSFGIPGASAGMDGTYNLLNHKIDLHGRMQVDTKISKTSTGVKALLLKAMDPFFKKKKKGEVVPVHISGTYEHPQFGLDLAGQKGQRQQGK